MGDQSDERSGASRTPYPLRVGAIDIGSNGIRFMAAEFSSRRAYKVLEYAREAVRIGAETFHSGEIGRKVVRATVEAVARFRERMDALSLHGYRAVATSAVRDSANAADLLEEIRHGCGVQVETIGGTEEARLVWLAVRNRVDLGTRRWVLVDLGGGSVEVSLIDRERLRWTESYPLGTVRLLEELGDVSTEPPARVQRRLQDHVAMLRIAAVARSLDAGGIIATGGNIEDLARLAAARPSAAGVSRVTLKALHSVIERLAELSPPERVKRLDLREDRADVILPAGVVYEQIARLVRARTIVVPYVGVKEGLLHDVVEDILDHGGHEARLEREVIAGALALGRRYDFDAAHAGQVARLAMSLFDQLGDRHELGDREKRVLIAAALLHDIGQYISYRRHHRHSYYLISHSDLPGLTPEEIRLAAVVARYHRRSEPQPKHEGYDELKRGERDVVDRLAAILRIADALDRSHEQRVAEVTATSGDGGELLLALGGTGDLLPELWALKKKAAMFERIYEVKVRVQGADTEAAPG